MKPKRTKVQELSIFTVGIGVILAALTLWLTFAMEPTYSPHTKWAFRFAMLISVIYVALGAMTGVLKNRPIIMTTMVVLVAGLLTDLLLGLSIPKAVVSGLIIMLVVKTGRQALAEVNPDGSHQGETALQRAQKQ